jgi:hypothetical protein
MESDPHSFITMLTQAQEQFLTEFYNLCSRYKFAGINPFSRGLWLNRYEVALTIELTNASADKKRPGRRRSNR